MSIDCDYVLNSQSITTRQDGEALSLIPPTSTMQIMASDLIATNLRLLFNNNPQDALSTPAKISVDSLRHFHQTTSLTLGSPAVAQVMHAHALQAAWSHPYLMHLILAMSCAHQVRLLPDSAAKSALQYVGISNWTDGLRLFQTRLAQGMLGADDSEAVIATVVLVVFYTFSLSDDVGFDLTSTRDDNDTLDRMIGPLAATCGFKALWALYGYHLPGSRWVSILSTSDDMRRTFTNEQPGISGLPRAFVELCQLDTTSTPINNPYHRILRFLTPILRVQRSTENFQVIFAFCGRTWGDFKPLLLCKDARAMLLLAYWLGALRQVDQWWLTTRAKTQCLAIVDYLRSLHNERLDALLLFPAAFGTLDADSMWALLDPILYDSS